MTLITTTLAASLVVTIQTHVAPLLPTAHLLATRRRTPPARIPILTHSLQQLVRPPQETRTTTDTTANCLTGICLSNGGSAQTTVKKPSYVIPIGLTICVGVERVSC